MNPKRQHLSDIKYSTFAPWQNAIYTIHIITFLADWEAPYSRSFVKFALIINKFSISLKNPAKLNQILFNTPYTHAHTSTKKTLANNWYRFTQCRALIYTYSRDFCFLKNTLRRNWNFTLCDPFYSNEMDARTWKHCQYISIGSAASQNINIHACECQRI